MFHRQLVRARARVNACGRTISEELREGRVCEVPVELVNAAEAHVARALVVRSRVELIQHEYGAVGTCE